MTAELFADARTEPDGAASLLTDVLGVVGSSMPKTEYGKQEIYTPDDLAKTIVSHFKPAGRVCEPCKGGGAFVRAMPGCEWFEIEEGRDFLKAEGHWDWVVTNPPWKDAGVFLEKAMAHADNVVFLTWLTAVLTKARHRKIVEAGFGIVEMLLVPTPPPPWPQSGFQLAATWIRRGWQGGAAFTTPNAEVRGASPLAGEASSREAATSTGLLEPTAKDN